MKRKVIFVSAICALGVLLFAVFRVNWQGKGAGLPKTIEEYRTALRQPDFGMFFIDDSNSLHPPAGVSSMQDAKEHLYHFIGRRTDNAGTTESIGGLIGNYSAVAGKRVSHGRSMLQITNAVSYDDSKPKTRRETLKLIEAILATNGAYVFPLNATNVVLLTKKDLAELRHPIPEKE